ETMRNWFYKEEFQTGGNHIDSFLRNIGTYDNQQFNTYEQGLSTLIESLMIADQLAHSSKLTGDDTSTNSLRACLCNRRLRWRQRCATTFYRRSRNWSDNGLMFIRRNSCSTTQPLRPRTDFQ